MTDPIETPRGELIISKTPPPACRVELGTLMAGSPHALIEGATAIAAELARIIRTQHLAVQIQGREFVRVEGWTTLGVMLGVVPREVMTTAENGVYTSIVELARISDQAIISRASAECGNEKPWCDRPRYARRSMAISRATGKACRLAFSWVMSMSGYEPTPAEEMLDEVPTAPPPPVKISDRQRGHLYGQIKQTPALQEDWVREWCAVHNQGSVHFGDLPPALFEDLLRRLPAWAELERTLASHGIDRAKVLKWAHHNATKDGHAPVRHLADLPPYLHRAAMTRAAGQWKDNPRWAVAPTVDQEPAPAEPAPEEMPA